MSNSAANVSAVVVSLPLPHARATTVHATRRGTASPASFAAASVQTGFLVRLRLTRVRPRGLLSINSISVGLFLLVACTTRRSARRGYFGPTWTIACRTSTRFWPRIVQRYLNGALGRLNDARGRFKAVFGPFLVPHHMTPCDTPTSRFEWARGAFGARMSLFRAARTFPDAPTTLR